MKTLVFYQNNGAAAKARAKEITAGNPKGDRGQAIQADAYRGGAMGADAIEIMDCVPAHLKEFIEAEWAKLPTVRAAPPGTGQVGALLTDGPTVDEWVRAGYRASGYPPSGYASRSTQAEIDAAVAAQGSTPGRQPQKAEPLKVELAGLTNNALRGYAESRGIDLGTARTKEEIIRVIEASGKE